jgi:hypothetical protein
MVPKRPMRTLWGQLGCWLVQVQAPAQIGSVEVAAYVQDRARVGGHRAGIGLRIVCALDDLALAMG